MTEEEGKLPAESGGGEGSGPALRRVRLGRRSGGEGGAGGGPGWRRPLFLALVFLLLLPVAYYVSYVIWGRDMAEPLEMFAFPPVGMERPLGSRLGLAVMERVYVAYEPMRRWERQWDYRQLTRDFAGRWGLEDGRTVELEFRMVNGQNRFRMTSASIPDLHFEGRCDFQSGRVPGQEWFGRFWDEEGLAEWFAYLSGDGGGLRLVNKASRPGMVAPGARYEFRKLDGP